LNVVVDASVALKWFFRSDEADIDAAMAVLEAVGDARVSLLQPPHFIAEVGAVLARESPSAAKRSVADLLQIDMEVLADRHALPRVIGRAVELSVKLEHHLFDTLYHAVALEFPAAVLVTADERYFRKASRLGRIVRLADFATV
jgi:predicted nucleic acid-binding protein